MERTQEPRTETKEQASPFELTRRASLFEAFVAKGFNWSGRRRGGERVKREVQTYEPQIIWKNDVKGGRPVSKRDEIRRKIARTETHLGLARESRLDSKGHERRSPPPGGRTPTPREGLIPSPVLSNEAVQGTMLEITGFDLLGLWEADGEGLGETTPPRRKTKSRPASRPITPTASPGTRVECPLLVRRLVGHSPPGRPPTPPPPGQPVDPQRTWTKDSSMSLPLVDEDFFRAISSGHRGRFGRAFSAGFVRQLSPMLRQISPGRFRQVSQDVAESLPGPAASARPESEDTDAEGILVTHRQSEPAESMTSGSLRASELPLGSISFNPQAPSSARELWQMWRGMSFKEGKSPWDTPHDTEEKGFGLKDDDLQDPPEFPAEESQGAVEPAEAPEALPTAAEEAAEAAEVGSHGDPLHASATELPESATELSAVIEDEEVETMYLVPPWALRAHLNLDPLSPREAPALRGRRPSSQSSRAPSPSTGLVSRLRRLVNMESPRETEDGTADGRGRTGPPRALGTSMLSMSHPSRSTAKAQLAAQTQAIMKCHKPRSAALQVMPKAASTEPWRPGAQDAVPEPEESEGDSLPPELSFAEEDFFLTEN
ncbi:unnamed protein product [Durusdinium trenchii]|uniref:Uncharacterized protein n=1 Tax=Durusdinium trenchii TaxID=1381693 RepID=A0ABP0KXQ4_9DINO